MDEEGNRRVRLFELYEANPELFKSAPKATVICLTYNHEAYLDKAIQSILDQEVDFPIEIIVHDDASTDRSIEILLRYKEYFPDLFYLKLEKENQFNLGRKGFFIQEMLNQAKGEYIFWLDTDDFWVGNNKIIFTCSFLDKNKKYSSAFHNYDTVDNKGDLITRSCLPDNMKSDISQERLEIMDYSYVLPSAFCIRNIKLKLPDEFNLTLSGDMFYPMLMATHGPCKYINETFSFSYRQTDKGMWTSQDQILKDKSKLIFALAVSLYMLRNKQNFSIQFQLFFRLIPSLLKYLQGQKTRFFPFDKYFK